MTDPPHIEIIVKTEPDTQLWSSQQFVENNAVINPLDPHFAPGTLIK